MPCISKRNLTVESEDYGDDEENGAIVVQYSIQKTDGWQHKDIQEQYPVMNVWKKMIGLQSVNYWSSDSDEIGGEGRSGGKFTSRVKHEGKDFPFNQIFYKSFSNRRCLVPLVSFLYSLCRMRLYRGCNLITVLSVSNRDHHYILVNCLTVYDTLLVAESLNCLAGSVCYNMHEVTCHWAMS